MGWQVVLPRGPQIHLPLDRLHPDVELRWAQGRQQLPKLADGRSVGPRDYAERTHQVIH
jgi:hypothetical protein